MKTHDASVAVLPKPERIFAQSGTDIWRGNWLQALFGALCLLWLMGSGGLATAGELAWVQQFGTVGDDSGSAIVSIPSGMYVAGSAAATLPGPNQSGSGGGFLRKYDANGNVVWTRQFVAASAEVLASDGGNLYVAGYKDHKIYVRKFDANGTELWLREIDTIAQTNVTLSADAGGIYIPAVMPIGPSQYGELLHKFDANGNLLWAKQVGSGDWMVTQTVVVGSIAASGAIYVSGKTSDEVLLQKFDAAGNTVWSRQYGRGAFPATVAADTSGVYVYALASNMLPGKTGVCGCIRKFDHNGNELWTIEIPGQAAFSNVTRLTSFPYGLVVAGTVFGDMPGEHSPGDIDAYVLVYDRDGKPQWNRNIGSAGRDNGWGVAADYNGIYLAGSTDGAFPGQTQQSSPGGNDAFVARISPLFSSLVGDKDDFQPGNNVDVAPKSARVLHILDYIATDSSQRPAANLDEGGTDWFDGTNRPLGYSHLFNLPSGAQVSGASLKVRIRGAAEFFNDAFIYDQSTSPSEYDPDCYAKPPTCTRQAYSPLIAVRDLLGREPQENEVVELNIDLSKVPVRTKTQSVPGGHWSAKPDEYRNLLGLVNSGQLNLVLADDSAVDYSELSIGYVLPGAPQGDMNGDGIVDQRDLNILMKALNTPAYGPQDPRDIDHDGKITILDVRKLLLRCAVPGCGQ